MDELVSPCQHFRIEFACSYHIFTLFNGINNVLNELISSCDNRLSFSEPMLLGGLKGHRILGISSIASIGYYKLNMFTFVRVTRLGKSI